MTRDHDAPGPRPATSRVLGDLGVACAALLLAFLGVVAPVPAGAAPSVDPTPSSTPSVLVVPVPPDSAESGGASGETDELRGSRAPAPEELDEPDQDEGGGFPWFGSIVLALCVVLSAAWVLRVRARG